MSGMDDFDPKTLLVFDDVKSAIKRGPQGDKSVVGRYFDTIDELISDIVENAAYDNVNERNGYVVHKFKYERVEAKGKLSIVVNVAVYGRKEDGADHSGGEGEEGKANRPNTTFLDYVDYDED